MNKRGSFSMSMEDSLELRNNRVPKRKAYNESPDYHVTRKMNRSNIESKSSESENRIEYKTKIAKHTYFESDAEDTTFIDRTEKWNIFEPIETINREDQRNNSAKLKFEPLLQKSEKDEKTIECTIQSEGQSSSGSTSSLFVEKENDHIWRWWKESNDERPKWTFLQHKGPFFAPRYVPLPSNVTFLYDGKEMKLSLRTEEVATFYARMFTHEYTTKDTFNENFFKDWRKIMTPDERESIRDLAECDFGAIHEYYLRMKSASKEEKQITKRADEKIRKKYGTAIVDGHREKIGNFRMEPPGLFRGRGTHPKMGRLKLRVMPEDVVINCSKDSKIPSPPAGHNWKEVKHDDTVTWLASWTDNITGHRKYVAMKPGSKFKAEKDRAKYDTARKLNERVREIRRRYRHDWQCPDASVCQRAVALYLIDKLSLRVGNEKRVETADTVGCCSLRCQHVRLHDEFEARKYVVELDFLGKDSVRYFNRVQVERIVFERLKLFTQHKRPRDDLFDKLNTRTINEYLHSFMRGLTSKVFRTYNASTTLQERLKGTRANASIAEKLSTYDEANRRAAVLCNHRRAIPKTFAREMKRLHHKINECRDAFKSAKKAFKAAKLNYEARESSKNKKRFEKHKHRRDRAKERLKKLKFRAKNKEENKLIALGTSKLNYLDPRISVAWCKKYDIPIEKIYNKTQREIFRWSIDTTGPEFVF